jgi:uncharacterized protein
LIHVPLSRRWLPPALVILGAVFALAVLVVPAPVRGQTSADLFLSEYIEGSSNNKALEIYNGTGAPVDLAAGGYTVQMYFNGSATAGLTINLTGTVAAGDVFVLAQSSADPAILAQADQTNGSGWFNGDDAVVLRKGTTVLDVIGQIGADPGTEWGTGVASTADNTLRRKAAVTTGDANGGDAFDPAARWDGFATDTFAGLGTYGPGGTPPPTPAPTVRPIGEVQGVVANDADGQAHVSPLSGQTVRVQGVIYQTTLARTNSGGSNYGFFLQNTAETDDDQQNSSDGIFVFLGGTPTFPAIAGVTPSPYTPRAGDEVVVEGRVGEFFNMTQLTSPQLVRVVRSGVALDTAVTAFDANPPADLAEAYRYWERREGMRGRVPQGSIVLNGRNVFPANADSEIWVARPDSAIAQRSDPYARRSFRDPHPLDDLPAQLFDNGNGYRILLGGNGVKAAANDNTTLLAPARTFDTLTNAPVGGVNYTFNKYRIEVGQQPTLRQGVDPSRNAPPQGFVRQREYGVATYNVENLYDYRDDPFDGCDFAGNSGCPGVRPPFDYVPASAAEYQAHLRGIAQQIVQDLHAPDLILVQEAEDQDICTVAANALSCGTANNADSKPDTLQELALTIRQIGGPAYDAAYDRDGADDRGIVSGFLYRTDRVQLLAAPAGDPVLGAAPSVQYRGAPLPYNAQAQNPKALNAVLPADVDRSTGTDGSDVFTRAPQVGLFRIWRVGIGRGNYTDVYAVSNHFSSGPETRVGQRREQAAYNAAIAGALLRANPNARVVVGGDFNVFPRPDDPFAPPATSDQLAPLYNAGLTNLYDTLVRQVPASAYSYVFQGQAQTLDQLFVSRALFNELEQVRVAHINADWPAEFEGDGPRGVSDHDPQLARFRLASAESDDDDDDDEDEDDEDDD